MRVFADTHYYIALLSVRDASHRVAARWQVASDISEVVTTSWVLLEFADAMHLPREREIAAQFVDRLLKAPLTRIVPASEDSLWRGFALYRRRPDKAWSLTD